MTSDLSTPATHEDGAEPRAVLDGNAAAGEFAGILASDPTTVTVRCGNCGAAQAFGQLQAYLGGPGTVLRCCACEAMVAVWPAQHAARGSTSRAPARGCFCPHRTPNRDRQLAKAMS